MIKRFAGPRAVLSVLTVIGTAATATAAPTSLFSGTAQAETSLNITEFPATNPDGITAGPDGNLWFTEQGVNQIGRITPSGVTTEFQIPTANTAPTAITAGPDGNLWFTESNPNQVPSRIGRITPSGQVTEFPVDTTSNLKGSNVLGIAAGPDGSLWFTIREADKIGRISTSGVVTEFPLPTSSNFPQGIALGPDGNLWFTEPNGSGTGKIGRITTSGAVTEFPIPTPFSYPTAIAAGSDGNLWFTEEGANKIGRITPDGDITEFAVPTANGQPEDITAGPNGNLWFTENDPALTPASRIGQITPSGDITEYPLPGASDADFGITTGPDDNLWFTEYYNNKIGRVNLSAANSDNDLAIARPADITANATSPSGATLSYPLPVVTDPDDATTPVPDCSPAPGSVFAIGTTTVTCTATDPDDTNSPVSTSFTVTVKGAAAQLTDLHQAVQGVGTGSSLANKIAQAQSYLAAGDITDASATLDAFIHEVTAQTGKSIPAGQASQLIADARRIQAVIGQ